jgi:hypothetical protein
MFQYPFLRQRKVSSPDSHVERFVRQYRTNVRRGKGQRDCTKAVMKSAANEARFLAEMGDVRSGHVTRR